MLRIAGYFLFTLQYGFLTMRLSANDKQTKYNDNGGLKMSDKNTSYKVKVQA